MMRLERPVRVEMDVEELLCRWAEPRPFFSADAALPPV